MLDRLIYISLGLELLPSPPAMSLLEAILAPSNLNSWRGLLLRLGALYSYS